MAARQTRPTPPRLTAHAADRWSERAERPGFDIDPWTAWVDGIEVELPAPWGLKGDEARYHPETGVVLCRADGDLPTIYDLSGPDAHPVVVRAVEQQLDELEVTR